MKKIRKRGKEPASCFLENSVREAFRKVRVQSGYSQVKLRVVIGVSGGADSCVLLDVINTLREELQIEPVLCHINHNLRVLSDQDKKFVSTLAEEYKFPFFSQEIEKSDLSGNTESWGREERYRFFEQVRVKVGAHLILTAHHQHDVAETVLFRLLNGRITTDARFIAFFDSKRSLCRPLLAVPRALIEEYCREKGIEFVEDETNKKTHLTRNWIRHKLIPLLKTSLNPNLVGTLSEVAERLTQDEEVLCQEAKRLSETIDSKRTSLLCLPKAYRWRVLRQIAEAQIGDVARRLGFRTLSQVISHLEDETVSSFRQDIGYGICFSCSQDGTLVFSSKKTS